MRTAWEVMGIDRDVRRPHAQPRRDSEVGVAEPAKGVTVKVKVIWDASLEGKKTYTSTCLHVLARLRFGW